MLKKVSTGIIIVQFMMQSVFHTLAEMLFHGGDQNEVLFEESMRVAFGNGGSIGLAATGCTGHRC